MTLFSARSWTRWYVRVPSNKVVLWFSELQHKLGTLWHCALVLCPKWKSSTTSTSTQNQTHLIVPQMWLLDKRNPWLAPGH